MLLLLTGWKAQSACMMQPSTCPKVAQLSSPPFFYAVLPPYSLKSSQNKKKMKKQADVHEEAEIHELFLLLPLSSK